MSEVGLELAFGSALNLSFRDVFEALFVSMLLSMVVATVYRLSQGDRLISPALQGSLVLLSMVGAMVMMVIGNNLARAFSLVGALAIVRFRTRLRSPWDITFVFFALAVGIASGTLAYRVAFLGTVMISLASLCVGLLPLGGLRRKLHRLRVDVAAYSEVEAQLDQIFEEHLKAQWLLEVRSMRFGETLSYRYRVILAPKTTVRDLARILADTEGVEQVLLIDDDEASGEAG